MGQITGDSAALFKLLEPATGVLPSDFRETLPDLDADGVTNSRPPVVQTDVTGYARQFDGATPTGLEGIDTGSGLNLTRSMTVQCLVRLDLAAQDASGIGVVASYGFRDSSPEDLQFSLELDVVSLAARTVNVKLRWEDDTGTLEAGNAGETFAWPLDGADDAAILLTVVREWRSDTEAIVSYYVNETLLGSETSTDGLIGGAAGATFLLGNRGDGAGGYELYFEGELDAIELFEFPMTAEEIRQIYRRRFVHTAKAYESLKALLPERVYSSDPDSIIQRELQTEAAIFGATASKIFEVKEDFLPDRAWSFLADWERVLGLIPGPADTLDDRRNRILSFLRTIEGFSVEGIQNALTATFDLDASQIEILEFSNLTADDFATALSDYWQSIPNGHSISIAAGELVIATAVNTNHAWQTGNAPHVKGVLDGDLRDAEPTLDSEISVELVSESLPTVLDSICGLAFINQAGGKALFYGIQFNGVTTDLVTQTYASGTYSTVTNHGIAPARPFILNCKFTGGTSYDIGTAVSGSPDTITPVATVTGPDKPDMIALGVFARSGITGGTSISNTCNFDNFRLFTPNGLAVFNWYAYRDPLLPGDPDVAGANLVVRRIKPAHTNAAAVAIRALKFDDPDSFFDDGPLG